MSEYIITKRTECETCRGTGIMFGEDAVDACPKCGGASYREILMDADKWLLSRLAKLVWDERWGEHTGTTKEMGNPRFEGGEG